MILDIIVYGIEMLILYHIVIFIVGYIGKHYKDYRKILKVIAFIIFWGTLSYYVHGPINIIEKIFNIEIEEKDEPIIYEIKENNILLV